MPYAAPIRDLSSRIRCHRLRLSFVCPIRVPPGRSRGAPKKSSSLSGQRTAARPFARAGPIRPRGDTDASESAQTRSPDRDPDPRRTLGLRAAIRRRARRPALGQAVPGRDLDPRDPDLSAPGALSRRREAQCRLQEGPVGHRPGRPPAGGQGGLEGPVHGGPAGLDRLSGRRLRRSHLQRVEQRQRHHRRPLCLHVRQDRPADRGHPEPVPASLEGRVRIARRRVVRPLNAPGRCACGGPG